jgi:hypothetical protein
VVVPLVGGLSLRVGERLLRLQRIIDQNDVGPASGEHTAGGGGEPVALAGSYELLHCLAVRDEAGREDLPIPRAQHDAAAIAGELVGELTLISHKTLEWLDRAEPREKPSVEQGSESPRTKFAGWYAPREL